MDTGGCVMVGRITAARMENPVLCRPAGGRLWLYEIRPFCQIICSIAGIASWAQSGPMPGCGRAPSIPHPAQNALSTLVTAPQPHNPTTPTSPDRRTSFLLLHLPVAATPPSDTGGINLPCTRRPTAPAHDNPIPRCLVSVTCRAPNSENQYLHRTRGRYTRFCTSIQASRISIFRIGPHHQLARPPRHGVKRRARSTSPTQ